MLQQRLSGSGRGRRNGHDLPPQSDPRAAARALQTASENLAAYGARGSDPAWPRADLSLRRPVWSSSGTLRLVQLAFRGVHHFSLTAHFLQASTYGREVVGSARSGHVSSHPLGRVLVVLYGPRAGTKRIVRWLTSRGKSRPPQGPYRAVLGDQMQTRP